MSKKEVYALRKLEHSQYLKSVFTKRTNAFDILEAAFKDKKWDEWTTFYSHLCEYIGILFYLEDALEEVSLSGDWDKKNQYWLLQPETATRISSYITLEAVAYRELSFFNTSLLIH